MTKSQRDLIERMAQQILGNAAVHAVPLIPKAMELAEKSLERPLGDSAELFSHTVEIAVWHLYDKDLLTAKQRAESSIELRAERLARHLVSCLRKSIYLQPKMQAPMPAITRQRVSA